MPGMEWSFYKGFKSKFEAGRQNKQSPTKKWNVAVVVFEEGQSPVPTKLNFQDINAERINVCFKDKYLIISELNEMLGSDADENQFLIRDAKQDFFEKIICFPKTIKKVAFSAVQTFG